MAVCSQPLHIPSSRLFVSEPSPAMFGNGKNEPSLPGWNNGNWLKSRFHFSFAEYHSYENSNFGVLRVMNDDLVQPRRMFGEHGHRDMEIVTYIVEGKLTHKDSMGTEETLGPSSVQFMTAGTGVRHSEGNDQDKPLRFIQSWIVPRSRGLKPNYGSSSGDKVNAVNQWAHLAGDVMNKSITCPIKLNQDVNMHVIKISPNTAGGDFSIGVDRQAYLLCVEGSAVMNGAFSPLSLSQHDGSEIYSGTNIAFTAGSAGVHLLLFEMAFDKSGGRKDLL